MAHDTSASLCKAQVAVTDAEVRRGMLMLRPQNVVLLNGQARSGGTLQPLRDDWPPDAATLHSSDSFECECDNLQVDALEAARQRMLEVWRRPARGTHTLLFLAHAPRTSSPPPHMLRACAYRRTAAWQCAAVLLCKAERGGLASPCWRPR